MPATTASGLIIDDVVVGSGDLAAAGQKVSVHYTGWLFYGGERGKKFDDYAFVPVHGRFQTALLALERPSGRYAGAVYVPEK